MNEHDKLLEEYTRAMVRSNIVTIILMVVRVVAAYWVITAQGDMRLWASVFGIAVLGVAHFHRKSYDALSQKVKNHIQLVDRLNKASSKWQERMAEPVNSNDYQLFSVTGNYEGAIGLIINGRLDVVTWYRNEYVPPWYDSHLINDFETLLYAATGRGSRKHIYHIGSFLDDIQWDDQNGPLGYVHIQGALQYVVDVLGSLEAVMQTARFVEANKP
jgi:hypothetical protein